MKLAALRKRVVGSVLARHSVAYGLTAAVAAGTNVAVGPILTHYLEPSDYGIAALFLALFNALLPLTGLGSTVAVRRRYYQQEAYDYPSYVVSAGCLTFANAAFLTLVTFATYEWWGSPAVERAWAVAFLPWVLGKYLFDVTTMLLQLRGRPIAYGVVTWIDSLLTVAATLTFVVGLGFRWDGRVLGNVLGAFVLGVGCFVLLVRLLGAYGRPRWQYVKDVVAFGAPSVPLAVLDRAAQFGDRAVVAAFVGVDAAGFYTLGVQISGLAGRVATAFNRAWQPWLFERLDEGTESAKRRVARALHIASAGLVATALALWLAVRWLFPLLIGDKYTPAIEFIPWMCLAFAVRGIASLYTGLIIYTEKTTRLPIVAVQAGASALLLTALLVWRMGLAGAAYALFATALVRFVLVRRAAVRLVSIPWI